MPTIPLIWGILAVPITPPMKSCYASIWYLPLKPYFDPQEYSNDENKILTFRNVFLSGDIGTDYC